MAVQVLIRRKIVKSKVKEVAPLMVELRSLARSQPGYMSSESLKCIDPAEDEDYLIRSTWQSLDDWKQWLQSEKRSTVQKKIDELTQQKTEYKVYEALVGGIFPKNF